MKTTAPIVVPSSSSRIGKVEGEESGNIHIAVAVDLSAGAESAFRFAWHIAQKIGAGLEVLYVMDSIFNGQEQQSSGFLSGYQRTMQVELDNFIGKALTKIGIVYEPSASAAGAQTPEAVVSVHSKVLFGFPDIVLEEYSTRPDLLVMGTTGQSALAEKLFGSIPTAVSQNAHCPVLLIPPHAEFQGLHNILYASNFDSLDGLRIRQAVSFAQPFDAQLHFVHVGPAGEKDLELEQNLFGMSYDAAHPDRPYIFVKIVGDQVPEALYDYAFYHHIELLVFVTHRRGFWDNFLHKSITNQVAKGTDLPILVVHGEEV